MQIHAEKLLEKKRLNGGGASHLPSGVEVG